MTRHEPGYGARDAAGPAGLFSEVAVEGSPVAFGRPSRSGVSYAGGRHEHGGWRGRALVDQAVGRDGRADSFVDDPCDFEESISVVNP